MLAGIVPLQSGRAECGGRVATLIELGAGFGREFTGRENILLNGALNGLGRRDIEERLDDIVAFSELGHFVDVPVKTYSSGMLVRLGFAIAAHLDADVMLIDEVLAVGDEAFQRKCLRRINERILAGSTLVLVSHAPAAIERTCSRIVVLDGGRVVYDGPTVFLPTDSNYTSAGVVKVTGAPGTDGASPHSSEATTKSTRPTLNSRLRPSRSPSRPAGTSRAANTRL